MASYLCAKWRSAPADSPVEFYSELDDNRWETRKVGVFPNGQMGYAPARGSSNGKTRLGDIALPPLLAIQQQIVFEARSTSADEFESMWQQATKQVTLMAAGACVRKQCVPTRTFGADGAQVQPVTSRQIAADYDQ